MNNIIKIENLSYVYSAGTPFEKKALDDINIEIQEGEFLGIIGHTGSGKSTLMQHFNGLLKPTSGKVYFSQKDIWQKKDKKHLRFEVGLVSQYPEHQLFEETVYKDIAFGPTNMKLSKEEIDKRVHAAIDFVGLDEEILKKSPFDLSGGQKRRVAIAGVVSMNPKVLVLDEPTAGLDPKGRDDILEHIQNYHKTNKSTVIIVSHSMEDIARVASKVLVMNRAKIEMYDTVDKIFIQSKRLEEIGLSIPQITKVFNKLRQKGYPAAQGIYTNEQAVAEVLRLKSLI